MPESIQTRSNAWQLAQCRFGSESMLVCYGMFTGWLIRVQPVFETSTLIFKPRNPYFGRLIFQMAPQPPVQLMGKQIFILDKFPYITYSLDMYGKPHLHAENSILNLRGC